MKKYFLYIVFLLGIFFLNEIKAQSNLDGTQQNNIEQNIENITENSSNEDIDYTTILEQYNFYKQHPINLNSKEIESLRELNFVSDVQLNSLLSHVTKNKPLLNIYELQSIENWDLPTIKKLLPFVYVSNSEELKNLSVSQILRSGESTLDIRTQRVLENQNGFSKVNDSMRAANPSKYYLGDPFKHFFRYRFNSNNKIQFGITAEKDPGEEFFKGTQKNGFDYYTAYFFAKNIGRVKALSIGDYRAEFGQGLTFWTDLAFSKSVDLLVYKRNAKGIRAYNSLNENQYLRGVATTINITKNIEASVFLSRKKRDASISLDTTEAATDEGFSNFLLSGLHRTSTEVAKKNVVTETLIGSNLKYHKKTFAIGATAVSTRFDVTQQIPSNLYRAFDLTGNQNYNIGIDYSLVLKNVNFFGEGAQSANGGKAFISGALASLDPKLNFLVLYRNYARDYQGVYVRAIGETVGAQNEKGTLLGLQYKPLYNVTLSAYYDRFTFPWLRYKIDLPNATGNDFTCFLDYAVTKKIDLNFRYRRRNKPLNFSDITEGLNTIGYTHQDNFRFNAVYAINSEVRLKTRIDLNYFTTVSGQKSSGYLFYQDIVYKKSRFPLTLTMRYVLFDIANFNARIYTLETDLPFAYTFISYNGKGNRFYIMANYDINKRMEIWLRFSQTYFLNETSLNAGTPNESTGPRRSELKLQFRYKF